MEKTDKKKQSRLGTKPKRTVLKHEPDDPIHARKPTHQKKDEELVQREKRKASGKGRE